MNTSYPTKKQRGEQVLCRGSGKSLILVTILMFLLFTGVCADLLFRVPGQAQKTEAWIETFSLATPALWPAGSPLRHPETVHPGVDLRFSPGLELPP